MIKSAWFAMTVMMQWFFPPLSNSISILCMVDSLVRLWFLLFVLFVSLTTKEYSREKPGKTAVSACDNLRKQSGKKAIFF